MNTSLRSLTLALTLAAASLFCATTSARAQMVIMSLPYTITTGGLYVLNSNLSSSQTTGDLITVNASNVTIDFQGHFIAGPSGNTSLTTNGVHAIERSNVTIKNGTVAYCQWGIRLSGNNSATTNAVDAQIDNMRVTYCLFVGISMEYCPAGRITNCQVSQTGYSGASTAFGIEGFESGTLVANNVVSTVTATTAYGISVPGSFARQNTITNATDGVSGGKYQDNLTSGCTNNVIGGTDGGGNF